MSPKTHVTAISDSLLLLVLLVKELAFTLFVLSILPIPFKANCTETRVPPVLGPEEGDGRDLTTNKGSK
jgi:hypothetical protein